MTFADRHSDARALRVPLPLQGQAVLRLHPRTGPQQHTLVLGGGTYTQFRPVSVEVGSGKLRSSVD